MGLGGLQNSKSLARYGGGSSGMGVRGGGRQQPWPSAGDRGRMMRDGGDGGLAGDLDLAPPGGGQLLGDHAPLSLTIRGLPQAWGLAEAWVANRLGLLGGREDQQV